MPTSSLEIEEMMETQGYVFASATASELEAMLRLHRMVALRYPGVDREELLDYCDAAEALYIQQLRARLEGRQKHQEPSMSETSHDQ
jgi:hypothetical protein